MSERPADPARSTQNEDAFVGSLYLARSALSFATVVEGEDGGEDCTTSNCKVSRRWELHCGFCEEGEGGCWLSARVWRESCQVQMFNFVSQIGKQWGMHVIGCSSLSPIWKSPQRGSPTGNPLYTHPPASFYGSEPELGVMVVPSLLYSTAWVMTSVKRLNSVNLCTLRPSKNDVTPLFNAPFTMGDSKAQTADRFVKVDPHR